MKKSLLFILASLIAIFALTGCADEPAKEEGPKVTPINLKDPKTLEGTYDVKFFGTIAYMTQEGNKAVMSAVSTDCNKLKKSHLGQSFVYSDEQCNPNTRKLGGKVTISVDTERETLHIESKLQIVGPFFTSGLGASGKDDTYQFTSYSDVLFADITEQGINMNGTFKGVSGRNLTSNTSNPKSTFKVTSLGSTGIFIDMELIDKMVGQLALNAPTNVEAVKVSDTVENLDPNSLFVTADQLTDTEEKAIFEKFVKNPTK